jgi:hypothetical protein
MTGEIKVNSGIGWSYRPARLHGLAGRYDNPMPELTLSLSHGSMNSATAIHHHYKEKGVE